jgi:hypothetical protein
VALDAGLIAKQPFARNLIRASSRSWLYGKMFSAPLTEKPVATAERFSPWGYEITAAGKALARGEIHDSSGAQGDHVPLSLIAASENWNQISGNLAEPPRKRKIRFHPNDPIRRIDPVVPRRSLVSFVILDLTRH